MRYDRDAVKQTADLGRIAQNYVRLKKEGQELLGLCPFHQEHTPSFTISNELFKCFGCGAGGDVFEFIKLVENLNTFPEQLQRVAELSGVAPESRTLEISPNYRDNNTPIFQEHGPVVARYNYVDERGELLYQVRRHEPGRNGKKKDFSQHRRVSGEWVAGLGKGEDKVRQVLYRLPEVIAADKVALCEGEKDAHALTALGWVATTKAGGSNGPMPRDAVQALTGKTVVIFGDTDEPGQKYADYAAQLFAPVATVFMAMIPGEYKDISEYIDAGRQISDLVMQPVAAREPDANVIAIDKPYAHVQGMVAAAIKSKNPKEVMLLVPVLARIPEAEEAVHVQEIEGSFGKELNRQLFKAARKAERVRARAERMRTSANVARPSDLKEIQVADRPMRDIADEAMVETRARNNPPVTFCFSGSLARVRVDERYEPTVDAFDRDALRGILARSCEFVKFGPGGDKFVPPPPEIVADIYSSVPAVWDLPSLLGVVEIPTLRLDGTIIDQPGYDAASKVYYSPHPDLRIAPVSLEPTAEEVAAAKACIDDTIGEFPYVHQVDRANTLGLMLTPILRTAITGCTPFFCIDAPQYGTGKTLLVEILAMIITGRNSKSRPYPPNDEEMQKAILAYLRHGDPIISFDNIEKGLKSPVLAMALTSRLYTDRILGESKSLTLPNLATWVGTGNNLTHTADMTRRCCFISMDAKSSRPYLDRVFRHENVVQWAYDTRGGLIHALLTICRAWYAAGAPNLVARPLGSFESWHQTVGSILQFAHVSGFMGNYDAHTLNDDEGAVQWEAFLTHVIDAMPLDDPRRSGSFTVALLLERIQMARTEWNEYLPDSIVEYLSARGDAGISLGKAFARLKGHRFGAEQIRIEKIVQGDTKHKAVSRWQVVRDNIE